LRTELRRELKLLHRNLRSTMIYVTHDQVEAMTLASRIVVMRDGVIQQIGTPGDVYEKPDNLFVAGFLGAPGMNFCNGLLSLDGQSTIFASANLVLDVTSYKFMKAPENGLAVVLGIRPEHVRIDSHGKLTGVISLVEPMGNHQVVWIDCSGHLLCSVVHDPVEFKVDESVRFTIDTSKISLFEKSGEQRI
jgi:multiple sugar transport system ATP-binding protein